MWRDEPDSVKTEWKNKSENVKRQHLKDHPDYQYQPRRPSEKKRRMTKRKAAATAAQTTPNTSQSSAQSSAGVGTAQQLVDLGNMEVPSLNYTISGQMSTFTFDPSQQNQMELFGQMLENHNALTLALPAPAIAPVASSVLPTAAHNNQYQLEMTADDVARAESELFGFEASLEDTLSRELESMEKEKADEAAQAYNDIESQRFTEFLEQMPEHMWGMDFVQ